MPLQVRDFAYTLPEELIAQNPAVPRDAARLLIYTRATGEIQHAKVRDLPTFLEDPGVIVANNSRVRHSRLHATRKNGKPVEILILEHRKGSEYLCMLRGRSLKMGETFQITPEISAYITDIEEHPGMQTYCLTFSLSEEELEAYLDAHGEIPLPPYITDSNAAKDQYQTVFAGALGSAAAPTAGLHFTPELITQLKAHGQTWEEVTLHVGMGTFLPLREPELAKNQLHAEYTYISPETVRHITTAKKAHQRILAVGTTTTRTLESHSQSALLSGTLATDIFIYPEYSFKTVSALLTNFHLPHSSLLALVTAFIQNDTAGNIRCSASEALAEMHRIYEVAIAQRYRFFSFGDAMLIL